MSGRLYLFILSLISIFPYLCLVPAATYVKSLARRACLSEGFARAVEAYKAEVDSLTSERADLRAQMQRLSEDAAKHRSHLKHTLMAKLRVEEQEKKARDELRGVAYELRMVKDEL